MNGLQTAFQGTLGTDPDLRYTSTGRAVLNFTVAVSENRPGGDGAGTTWVRVSCWEPLAEELAERLHKGDEVYCEGRLSQRSWTGQDGVERAGLNVSAWVLQPLGLLGRRAAKRTEADRMMAWDALPAQSP